MSRVSTPCGRLTYEPTEPTDPTGEFNIQYIYKKRSWFTMSSIPAPLINGSIAYLVLAVVLIGLSLGSRATGFQTKDNVA
jgi:hypothetical protein